MWVSVSAFSLVLFGDIPIGDLEDESAGKELNEWACDEKRFRLYVKITLLLIFLYKYLYPLYILSIFASTSKENLPTCNASKHIRFLKSIIIKYRGS